MEKLGNPCRELSAPRTLVDLATSGTITYARGTERSCRYSAFGGSDKKKLDGAPSGTLRVGECQPGRTGYYETCHCGELHLWRRRGGLPRAASRRRAGVRRGIGGVAARSKSSPCQPGTNRGVFQGQRPLAQPRRRCRLLKVTARARTPARCE